MESNIVKQVELTSTEIDYIRFLYTEMIAYKNIVQDIILERFRPYEFTTDNYNHFMNEYKDTCHKYDITVHELLLLYAPEFVGRDDHSVTFNFDDNTMQISPAEKDCGEKGCGCSAI